MKLGIWIAVVLGAFLAGCSDPTPISNAKLRSGTQEGRINVVSAQTIVDARGYTRDILVMRDNTTGIEYLAVMGAGVTEMRWVSNGKTTYLIEE
jgi:hypothetical protein